MILRSLSTITVMDMMILTMASLGILSVVPSKHPLTEVLLLIMIPPLMNVTVPTMSFVLLAQSTLPENPNSLNL